MTKKPKICYSPYQKVPPLMRPSRSEISSYLFLGLAGTPQLFLYPTPVCLSHLSHFLFLLLSVSLLLPKVKSMVCRLEQKTREPGCKCPQSFPLFGEEVLHRLWLDAPSELTEACTVCRAKNIVQRLCKFFRSVNNLFSFIILAWSFWMSMKLNGLWNLQTWKRPSTTVQYCKFPKNAD